MAKDKSKSKRASSASSAYNVQRLILGVLLIGLVVSGLVLVYQGSADIKTDPDPGTALQDDIQGISQSDTATTEEEQ